MTPNACGLLRGRAPRLLLALALLAGALAAQGNLVVTGMPDRAPFTVEATADPARLVVQIDLKEGWHAYARDVGGGEPISLTVSKGSAFAGVGKLHLPKDEGGELHGRVKITQWLRPVADAKTATDEDHRVVSATLNLMVCDAMQCLPPIELTIRGKVEPLRVLLVTSSEDEHAARIGKFLTERGFVVKATTYPQVDAKTCDAQDLIVADSKLFRQDGEGGRKARDFPRTRTPIVAVGFLGHLIIEAHGLAMTSGYI